MTNEESKHMKAAAIRLADAVARAKEKGLDVLALLKSAKDMTITEFERLVDEWIDTPSVQH
jgi:hypothetical protein